MDRVFLLQKVNANLNTNKLNFILRIYLDLNDDEIYHLFIDNQHTVGHKSIFFGVRELTQRELDQPVKFTANYSIRTFQSACLYLDSNRIWQSQRLKFQFIFFCCCIFIEFPFLLIFRLDL